MYFIYTMKDVGNFFENIIGLMTIIVDDCQESIKLKNISFLLLYDLSFIAASEDV